MAQINLLKHSGPAEHDMSGLWSIVAKLLMIGLVAALAWYGFLYFQIGKQTKETADLRQQMLQEKKDPVSEKQRQELVVRRSQLTELNALLDSHVYWSNLLPVLASSTLRSIRYDSIRALADGTISLTASAPTNQDLDKFLQVFNNPEVNKNFKDVRISGISREEINDVVRIQFEARMKYNPQLLQYKK